MSALWHDFRHSIRALRTNFSLTVAIIITVGLAIGANTAIFNLLDQTVLRPLPVEKPGELAIVNAPALPTTGPGMMFGTISRKGPGVVGVSYPLYAGLRDRVPAFKALIAYASGRPMAVLAGPDPLEAKVLKVTGNYFEGLGVKAALGRTLGAEDDRIGAPNPVAVLSYRFWQSHLGSDPTVVGRTIRVSNRPLTIIGVAAASFGGIEVGSAPDLFVPLSMYDQLVPSFGPFTLQSPSVSILQVMARLKPGLRLDQTERIADSAYRQLLDEALARTPDPSARARAADKHLKLLPGGYTSDQAGRNISELAHALTLLMALDGLVLLIAAANVANLLLARGALRARELAIRLAVGASRGRLLGECLMENLLLALGAGAVGLVVSYWLGSLLLMVLPLGELAGGLSIAPDRRMAAFTGGIALLTGLVIWVSSALKTTHRTALPPLSGTAPRRAMKPSKLRRGLVIVQMALSLSLLCAASLFGHSLYKLLSMDLGVSTDRLTTFTVRQVRAPQDAELNKLFYSELLSSVRALPEVEAVSLTEALPLTGQVGATVIDDEPGRGGSRQRTVVDLVQVGTGYFDTMRMPFLTGRGFTPEEEHSSIKVAVVNESLARLMTNQGSTLGQRLGTSAGLFNVQVVGVVKDTRAGVRKTAKPTVFFPYFQSADSNRMTIVAKTRTDAVLPNATIRAVVNRIDPASPFSDLKSMNTAIGETLVRDRMLAILSVAFAALAASLSALGLFGLASFGVTQRFSEIGTRMALGAAGGSIVWLLMREVMALILVGSGIGLAIYIGFNQAIRPFLFDLSPLDVPTVTAAALALVLVALAAGILPAWRAARLHPGLLLRQE